VLINLMRNAMEAMRDSEPKELVVRIYDIEHGKVAIEVADTGPGISPEIAPKLFQAFNSSKATGMGVGLSISRRIVESHSGEMSVSRKEAGGATFVFTLLKTQKGGIANA
jgi:two-component system, LuxR family, sensor kinase FixL